MQYIQPVIGIAAFVGLCWALSQNRDQVPWRLVVAAIALQIFLAFVVLKAAFIQDVFLVLNAGVSALESATQQGTAFVFGFLGGAPLPAEGMDAELSYIFAFRALPMILVFSALSSLLFHWGIMQMVVRGIGWVLTKSMRLDPVVAVGTALNIFVGQVEAPLGIRPYLERISRSGLFVLMTAGLSTVSGNTMVIYARFLDGLIENPIGHLLVASLISAPAAIMFASILLPPESDVTVPGGRPMSMGHMKEANAVAAIAKGTLDGVQIYINVVAMLVVFVSIVALFNMVLSNFTFTEDPLTIQQILGWLMMPVAWLMGIPWAEAQAAGALLGTKTVLNELIAYLEFGQLPPETFSERSRLIMTYALCGFANLASMGIIIGGFSAMAPDRRSEIVKLAPAAILAGTLATCTTGAVVGLLTW